MTALLAAARERRSGVLVVAGPARSGKSALLGWAAEQVGSATVLSTAGRLGEQDLPFAALYDLVRPRLADLDRLPPRQADVLRSALAIGPAVSPPDRFAAAVATLSLLALLAEEGPVLLLVDDADRLDPETASALGFVLRRVQAEGIAVLLTTTGPLPEALALPGGELVELPAVQEDPALDQGVAELPERTRRALEVVVAGECDGLGSLLRALAADGLSLADLEPAELAGLLRSSDDAVVPVAGLRAVVLAQAPPDRVGRVHGLLAAEADGERAPQRRAMHLLAAGDLRDPAAVAAVESALPDPVHGLRALRRVVQLTPQGPDRDRRLRAAAEAALTAGHVPEALELVAEGLRTLDDPIERARLVHLRGRMALWGGPGLAEAAAELAHEAERIVDADPLLAGLMLADAGLLRCYGREALSAVGLAERAVALTGTEGGVPHALARTTLGVTLVLSDRIPDALPHLECYTDLLGADVALAEAAQMLQHVSIALAAVERYDDAVAIAARFITTARSLSAVGLLPMPLCLLANSAFWAGDWDGAQLAAAEARALAIGTGQPALELYAAAMLALVAGGRGQEERCRSWLERGFVLCTETGLETFRPTLTLAHALLELGLGRPEAALPSLLALKEMFEDQPGQGGLMHWRADLIAAYWQAGRGEAAYAELALAQTALAETGSRWERAALVRCRGLLADEPDAAVADLTAAVLGVAGWQPFEEGRSRLRLAERLAKDGRPHEAREQAVQASRLFVQLGAAGWERQARALLPDDAATVPAPPALTDLQHALRQDSAQGESAEALAAQYFLSPQTVRSELARAQLGTRPAATRVRLLGGFSVERDGQPVSLPAGVGVQAVKLVALHDGRLTVDRLVDGLWPDAEPGRGRARLRNVLNRLRRDAGELLVRSGDEVVLAPGSVVDVVEFEQAVEDAGRRSDGAGTQAARDAVALYAGELLPGDRYEDWTSAPRERLRGRYLALLDRLTAEAAGAGDADDATTWFERAVAVEPHDEERYVAMGRLLLALGRRSQAKRVVARCSSMLDDLGLPPSRGLQELSARLAD